MPKNEFWHDKHVIITGGSSGIGAALARALARRRAKIGLIARREDALAAITDEVNESGGQATFAVADVTSLPQTREAVQRLSAALGSPAVAIANAGTHRYTPGEAFSAEDVAAVFATNVTGAANLFDAVLPGMRQRRRGVLGATASIAGLVGLPEVGAYSASKAALITLMQSLRVDLHPVGIQVTTLCPGFVDTPFIAGHDRRVLRFVLTAEQAAERTIRALERGKAEAYFPWQTWLTAAIARKLPFRLYYLATRSVPRQADIESPSDR
jgi:hypothetical protein